MAGRSALDPSLGGLLFAQGLLPVAQVYLAKELVDELTRVLAAGDESFDRVFWIVSILAILLFVGHFLSDAEFTRLGQVLEEVSAREAAVPPAPWRRSVC